MPGIDDLERQAVLKPSMAEPEARAEYPEIDACSVALFGITADEAEASSPARGLGQCRSQAAGNQQVFAFEDAGWDVTDDKRRPLRMLGHFNQQLWLAIRGVAGHLPLEMEKPKADDWETQDGRRREGVSEALGDRPREGGHARCAQRAWTGRRPCLSKVRYRHRRPGGPGPGSPGPGLRADRRNGAARRWRAGPSARKRRPGCRIRGPSL